jgi:hypothetical protein
MRAVNAYLHKRKAEYLTQIREWQQSLKYYEEAVKLDHLRVQLLRDAGVANAQPQVWQLQALQAWDCKSTARSPEMQSLGRMSCDNETSAMHGLLFQVLFPLRPCMRIVLSQAELKDILSAAQHALCEAAREQMQREQERAEEQLQAFLVRRGLVDGE